jgi:hypothetical protein
MTTENFCDFSFDRSKAAASMFVAGAAGARIPQYGVREQAQNPASEQRAGGGEPGCCQKIGFFRAAEWC